MLASLAAAEARAERVAQPGAAGADDPTEGELVEPGPAGLDAAGSPPAMVVDTGELIEPFVAIVGGVRLERLHLREGESTQSRSPTVAASRFGVRGRAGPHVTFKSELEANLGGALGQGASVWEGQAMLSVRDQWVRYARAGWALAGGRITDEATIDFHSAHVADLLLLDFYTRWPIIFSGGDRGTGLMTTYEIGPALRVGATLHSTNPTGLTGSYQIGGALFPFTRPFGLAAAQVGRSANSTPDHGLHMYFGTLSGTVQTSLVEAKVALQTYVLDTQMSTDEDERIRGYNMRANVKVRLLGDRVAAFLNGSRNTNEMLDPMDATIKLEGTYTVSTFGLGVDYNYDGGNGVGIQYAQTRQDEPKKEVLVEHYLNIGTTYWVQPRLSVGARYGLYVFDDHQTQRAGHSSLFLTGRLIL